MAMNWRRLRWGLAVAAVILEIVAFVAWRLWLRGRSHVR